MNLPRLKNMNDVKAGIYVERRKSFDVCLDDVREDICLTHIYKDIDGWWVISDYPSDNCVDNLQEVDLNLTELYGPIPLTFTQP